MHSLCEHTANEATNARAAHAPQQIVDIGAPSLLSVLRPAALDMSQVQIPMATSTLKNNGLCEGKACWCAVAQAEGEKIVGPNGYTTY